jgi:hypothetical protein
MFTKELFEDYSLFRKYNPTEFEPQVEYWEKIPINMDCFVCDSKQTFNQTSTFYNDHPKANNGRAENRVFDVRYQCQSCRDFERRFLVYVSEDLNTIYKVGQYPEWEIKMDKRLEKTLHKHSKTYRKGLVCESQGYGIGAYFMHLKGDPSIYFRTAMFPVLFVLLMIFGIGLSNPDGVDGLPSWCTPNWDYATRR